MDNIFDFSKIIKLVTEKNPQAIILVDTNIVVDNPVFKAWKTDLANPLFVLPESVIYEISNKIHELDKRPNDQESTKTANKFRIAWKAIAAMQSKGPMLDGIYIDGIGWFIRLPMPEKGELNNILKQRRYGMVINTIGDIDAGLLLIHEELLKAIPSMPVVSLNNDRKCIYFAKEFGLLHHCAQSFPVKIRKLVPIDPEKTVRDAEKIAAEREEAIAKIEREGWHACLTLTCIRAANRFEREVLQLSDPEGATHRLRPPRPFKPPDEIATKEEKKENTVKALWEKVKPPMPPPIPSRIDEVTERTICLIAEGYGEIQHHKKGNFGFLWSVAYLPDFRATRKEHISWWVMEKGDVAHVVPPGHPGAHQAFFMGRGAEDEIVVSTHFLGKQDEIPPKVHQLLVCTIDQLIQEGRLQSRLCLAERMMKTFRDRGMQGSLGELLIPEQVTHCDSDSGFDDADDAATNDLKEHLKDTPADPADVWKFWTDYLGKASQDVGDFLQVILDSWEIGKKICFPLYADISEL